MNPIPLVLYHAECPDGFAAAWAVWLHMCGIGVEAEYRPVAYGPPPPFADAAGRPVILVDFSYPTPQLLELCDAAASVAVYDHHATALPAVQAAAGRSNFRFVFDVTRSGARIAWDEFHPGRDVPRLVRYVEDADLYRWALPRSREVAAALGAEPHEFPAWTRFSERLDDGVVGDDHPSVRDGVPVQKVYERLIEDNIRRAHEGEIAGYAVRIANCSCRQIVSEVGSRLAQGRAFGATWFARPDGVIQFSLRSRKPTGVNVSEVAQGLGGGGHPEAAGFQLQPGEHGHPILTLIAQLSRRPL